MEKLDCQVRYPCVASYENEQLSGYSLQMVRDSVMCRDSVTSSVKVPWMAVRGGLLPGVNPQFVI